MFFFWKLETLFFAFKVNGRLSCLICFLEKRIIEAHLLPQILCDVEEANLSPLPIDHTVWPKPLFRSVLTNGIIRDCSPLTQSRDYFFQKEPFSERECSSFQLDHVQHVWKFPFRSYILLVVCKPFPRLQLEPPNQFLSLHSRIILFQILVIFFFLNFLQLQLQIPQHGIKGSSTPSLLALGAFLPCSTSYGVHNTACKFVPLCFSIICLSYLELTLSSLFCLTSTI